MNDLWTLKLATLLLAENAALVKRVHELEGLNQILAEGCDYYTEKSEEFEQRLARMSEQAFNCHLMLDTLL